MNLFNNFNNWKFKIEDYDKYVIAYINSEYPIVQYEVVYFDCSNRDIIKSFFTYSNPIRISRLGFTTTFVILGYLQDGGRLEVAAGIIYGGGGDQIIL